MIKIIPKIIAMTTTKENMILNIFQNAFNLRVIPVNFYDLFLSKINTIKNNYILFS
ncbi:hypothetical protein [Mycoplasma sp. SG1]|uniref:hypothetical protein n=1 Tax=Mycoplasma sp. SG1 TaxID=2810348 RepID=UPI0020240F78|nr:hypothetical protein [Mycoplasma sp. SG1]URM53100.1 hypothetical protein JRW51_02000 [Mycoplasma sp. SG1]